ncbi:uracil phosphoribosyltransferase [Aerococcus urinaeequi]|jgi:uracil phosphoribosyltransferase|uniref:Uracil phosphoribosyltransferase n=2 Tax=Aerococcus TaxID=1375 RepID=A0A0U4HPZ6_9LACT|nr:MULTISPECIES: uracil phosphoribosyltransferase [Lactobacillales]KAF3303061.1 uracil phosphoribosyltransferase [Carnobacterium sp. PL17RED31]ALZ87786.1 uracil phosphoribosyltransferase [Aerococcus urinaeequi]AMB96727.1 uracil phosphoribosyltransferase [Aerococcus urinaeequi]KAF3300570.1 uracil phosphoribosyltransferase [Carnobacterium sp. PL12RED10]KAF3303644.1 uracil phosphoribosyltransferase [Carnobacterium sp. PL26RED25]
MSKLVVIDHPLVQHKMAMLRDKDLGTKGFRELVNEITMFLGYEVTRDLSMEEVEIETPLVKTTQKVIAGKKLAIAPILRAGLGMVDGMLLLMPAAKVGHIGMFRDEETLQPQEYFFKMPQDIEEREVIVVDPMLATGGSAIMAIDSLVKRNVKAESIKFVCLVAAPEGVKALQDAYPEVDIFSGALDEKLNEDGYILPGLGDAGDRLFGTL